MVKQYGLGKQTEFVPVQDPHRYASYLLKDVTKPTPDGSRIRRISYPGSIQRRWVDKNTGECKTGPLPHFKRVYGGRFTWAGGRAQEWRAKAQAYATELHRRGVISAPTSQGLRQKYGPTWFLVAKDDIERMVFNEDTDTWEWPASYEELRAASARAHRARERDPTGDQLSAHAAAPPWTLMTARRRNSKPGSVGNPVPGPAPGITWVRACALEVRPRPEHFPGGRSGNLPD